MKNPLPGLQLLFVFVAAAPYVSGQASISDCVGARFICADTLLQGTSMDQGVVADLVPANRGCLGPGENNSRVAWLWFTAASAGTVGCYIIPTTADIDFAVWGPFPNAPTCPLTTPPIRCTWVLSPGASAGLFTSSTDTSEFNVGDQALKALTVEAGQTYMMAVLNWNAPPGKQCVRDLQLAEWS